MPKSKKEKKEKQNKKIKVSHNKALFYLIIPVFVLLLISIVLLNYSRKINSLECKTDSDCIKQRVSCCSCQMGGKEACMSKQKASLYEQKIKNCEGIFCIAMYNCKDTTCLCKQGKCIEE